MIALMDVLVVGSGGREHALAWRLRRSPSVGRIICAPGNPGISADASIVPCNVDDLHGLMDLAKSERIDLTIVGPEQPLAAGIVDMFEQRGLVVFGPSIRAARLEWSKAFAKEFMTRHGIPTASYKIFRADEVDGLILSIETASFPIVLKADGLAAGKGVLICRTPAEALGGVEEIMKNKIYGTSGDAVVVEEFLEGEEVSLFVICDGDDYITLSPAQDYKRALDNDEGKNTGGMGSVAPSSALSQSGIAEVCRKIIEPTIHGMAVEGNRYKGCLYVGIMITQEGPRVIEFNSRFGDPETQVVLPLFEGDFGELLLCAANGRLTEWKRKNKSWLSGGAAVCVVLASKGYPGRYETGKQIHGLGEISDPGAVLVFHAGTALSGEKLVTSGGRVLGVTALSQVGNLREARDRAYGFIGQISFDGMCFRQDIGKRDVQQLPESG